MGYTMEVFWMDMDKYLQQGIEITDVIDARYGEIVFTMHGKRMVYTENGRNFRLDVLAVDIEEGYTEDEYLKSFALRLNRHMARKRMSQTDLSVKTGLSQPTISNYMHAACCPSLGNMFKIANALDVRVEDLTYPEPPIVR